KARRIPKSQICLIDCSLVESLPRAEWEAKVRPAIRRWLATNHFEQKIRCLVTVWDVPLKIAPLDAAGPHVGALRSHLEAQRLARQELLQRLSAEIDKVLPNGAPAERPPLKPEATHKDFVALLESAVQDARARVQERLKSHPNDASRAAL